MDADEGSRTRVGVGSLAGDLRDEPVARYGRSDQPLMVMVMSFDQCRRRRGGDECCERTTVVRLLLEGREHCPFERMKLLLSTASTCRTGAAD
jgi:hypothetical protein